MDEMARLIEPMIPALRRYARSLLPDRAAADDLVQDCLERAITNWGQRRSDGSVRSWVFTILHNLAISGLRQSARRGQPMSIEDASEASAAQPPQQEDALRRADVLAALSRLPDEQRSALLLVSVEDLSYAEAAKVLGVPIGTVMSRLSRGRERLRRELEGDSGGVVETSFLRRVK